MVERLWGRRLGERADNLIKRAEYSRSSAARIAHRICDMVDVDYYNPFSCLVGPIKSRGRIIEKAKTDYDGHVEAVSDGCRFMILFDDPRTIDKIRDKIIPGKNPSEFSSYLDRTDFDFLKPPKDMFDTPKKWGYMGFLLKFQPQKKLNLYTPFEIQITHRDLQNTYYPETHDLYESRRKQIELYEQAGIHPSRWDHTTLGTVQSMIEIHRDGAYETGVADYVNNWPSLDSIRILDHEDDITALDYEPFDYSMN